MGHPKPLTGEPRRTKQITISVPDPEPDEEELLARLRGVMWVQARLQDDVVAILDALLVVAPEGEDNLRSLSAKTGIARSTIGRWLTGVAVT